LFQEQELVKEEMYGSLRAVSFHTTRMNCLREHFICWYSLQEFTLTWLNLARKS